MEIMQEVASRMERRAEELAKQKEKKNQAVCRGFENTTYEISPCIPVLSIAVATCFP